MKSTTKLAISSALLVGALGTTGSAGIQTRPAHAAPPAVQQDERLLRPAITPIMGLSAQVAADVSARAPIARVQLLIDGKAVSPDRVRYDATHHRIIYQVNTLAAGTHVARLTVWDKAGYYSWQAWAVHVPAATEPAQPIVRVDRARIQPGATVTVHGRGFTPHASITISMGGMNTGAGGNYGSATADSSGRFSVRVKLATYPDGSALRPGTIVLVAHTPSADQKATMQIQVAR